MRKLLLTLSFLLLASPTWAAITFDAVDQADSGAAASLSFSHSVDAGCTNPFLVVDVHWTDAGSATITDMEIGGVNATLIDTVFLVDIGNRWIASYYRTGVSTGAPIAIDITMSGVVSSTIRGVSRSYCGVHQASPIGTAVQATGDNAGPAQSTVTSAVGEIVIAAAQVRNETLLPVQNEIYNDGDGRAASDTPGAASVTMQFVLSASSQWGILSTPVKPAAAAAAAVLRRTPLFFQ